MIKEPVSQIEAVVFTKDKSFTVQGWESLSPYKIGYVQSNKWVENNTKGMNTEGILKPDSVFKMLEAGRIDIAVLPMGSGITLIKKLGLSDIKILQPPVMITNLHHFINNKNKDLIPKLEAVLAEMNADGTSADIKNRILDQ